MRSVRKFLNALKFTYFSLFMITLSAVILFTFMLDIVQKETYELKEFQIAHEAIRSLKTVEDTVKTEQERDRAANEVAPVYQFSEDIAKNRQAIATSIFDFLIDVKKEMVSDNAETEEEIKITEKSVEAMREKLSALEEEEPELQLSDEAIANLLSEDINILEGIKASVVKVLGEELSKPLRTTDLTFAKYEIERQLRLSNTIPTQIEQPVISIARSLLVETEIFNEALTASRVEEARATVEPIRILQGQVIVREGQVIDGEVYRQLELAGLLTNKTQVKPLAGIALFVSVMMSILFLHFQTWRESSDVKKKSLVIALVVFLLTVAIMKLVSIIEPEFDLLIAFLFPTALASMLIKLLVNDRLALTISIIIAATAGIMLQDGYAAIVQMEIALYILFGSITSLYLLGNMSRRSTILRASLGVSICNLGFIAFYLLMTQTTYELTELTFYAMAAFTSGVLSGALTIGLLPFFETTFGLLSDMKLIELSNPNHPLLKKILTEAPGTYHHSVMVANLADAACETIGANGLLARVGSYYHDVGKTVRPRFFIENQHAEQNPHDTLPPKKSKEIIIAHTEDGAQLLEKHKMPREIVAIARQHHGTSLLKFFVFKAKELGEDVIEEEFRYPGPKPQTKEIAVISIADSVEAAVRSMKEPTSEKINALVSSIVSDKLRDGQFDECDLSMKELKRVERAMCETLNGMFHNRIEYPE
ncbi:HD family phosphohydrolase [Sporosarcina ureilytica]|uniref:Phosphohydrolase n=1 Tax=Sporosarcina ureilytica TaxID=298596 RepID=A0A1D8JGP6_9BACL|nr:HD family phosphohydrolase [Sporosarcina ureilytica]AOV07887.1 phosphohydrolase [Sporosarcina ureilytica]